MSDLALVARQVRYDNKAFWRNPPAAIFTFVFPLIFLFIFNVLFGDDPVPFPGGEVDPSTYFIPAIAALSVITACFVNIAISMSFARDRGLLKRARGTPLPAWVFVASRIVHATFVALLLVTIVVVAGALFYDVEIPDKTLVAFVVTVIVGAVTFSALGLAMTTAVRDAEAAPPMVNGVIIPLYLFSGIFVPFDADTPGWIRTLGDVFPVKHFFDALAVAFSPFSDGSGFSLSDLVIMGLWGTIGAVVAARYFVWEPRR